MNAEKSYNQYCHKETIQKYHCIIRNPAWEKWFLQAGRYQHGLLQRKTNHCKLLFAFALHMRTHMMPMSQRQMTSLSLVWQESLGVLYPITWQQWELEEKWYGVISKTTTLHMHHTFLYISLLLLRDYRVKMLIFTYYGERKQATTKFHIPFWAWIGSLGIQCQSGSSTFEKDSKWNNPNKYWKSMTL